MNPEFGKNVAKAGFNVGKETAKAAWWLSRNIAFPAVRGTHRWLNQPVPRVSRRVAAVALLGTGVVGAAAHARYDADHPDRPVINRPVDIPKPSSPFEYRPRFNQTAFEQSFPLVPRLEPQKPTSVPFANDQANEISEDIGVHAGSFFWPDANVSKKLTNFYKEEKALPIFSPKVISHAEIVEKAIKYERKGNINVALQLLTQESGGILPPPHTEVDQETGEKITIYGKWQVADSNFKNMKDVNGNPITTKEQMEDDFNNLRAALGVFEWGKSIARTKFPNLDEAGIERLAAAAYNGGKKQAQILEGEVGKKAESLEYSLSFYSFEVTAEIATRLRKSGLTDDRVIIALFSKENEARLKVLKQIKAEYGPKTNNVELFRLIAAASKELSERNVNTKSIKIDGKDILIEPVYEAELANPNKDGRAYWDTNPGLERCVASSCGRTYDLGTPDNFSVEKWREIFRRRPAGDKGEPVETSTTKSIEKPTPGRPILTREFDSQLDRKWKNNPKYPNWGTGEANCGPSAYANLKKLKGIKTANAGEEKEKFMKNKIIVREDNYNVADKEGENLLRGGYTAQGEVYGGLTDLMRAEGFDVKVVLDKGGIKNKPEKYNELDISRMFDLQTQGYKFISGGWPSLEGKEIPHVVTFHNIERGPDGKVYALIIDSFNGARTDVEFARIRYESIDKVGQLILAVK